MSEGKAVDAVRSAVAALNDGDIDGYLRHFEPACRRWIAGFAQPLALVDVGNGLRQLSAAFDGLHLDEDVLFGDERFACARWRMRGRHTREYLECPPTGLPIEVETCEVYEIGGDLVVTTWVYGDVLGQLVAQIAAAEGDGT
jgi:SnoaL-like polyketide cyclase